MGKKRKIPSYKELIAKERAKIDKEIRETEYPWLNLWRLIRDPCRSYNCTDTHYGTISDRLLDLFMIFIVFGGILGYLWWQLKDHVPPKLFVSGYVVTPLFLLYTFLHIRHHQNWNAHADRREDRRRGLEKERVPHLLLSASLTNSLKATYSQLFDFGSEFAQWRRALINRDKNSRPRSKTELVPQTPTNPTTFRCAATEVRIQVVEEVLNFTLALQGLNAFEEHAREQRKKFERDIEALSAAMEAYTHTKGIPAAEQNAKEELTRLEAAIETGVTAFHLALYKLEKDTARACAEAASALTANFALEAEETANAIRGEGSKLSFRAKRSA